MKSKIKKRNSVKVITFNDIKKKKVFFLTKTIIRVHSNYYYFFFFFDTGHIKKFFIINLKRFGKFSSFHTCHLIK